MKFINLLGKKLKDDSIIELLELNDIDVIYDFDLNHENVADIYWAQFKENGFEFKFDENQQLNTIFLYIKDRDGYNAINKDNIDIPILESFLDAKIYFDNNGLSYNNSPSDKPEDRMFQKWIKSNNGNFTTHYEFDSKELRMITITSLV